jgi:hypothetical protein
MPKKCKSDEHYAISLDWSTRTLGRNNSRREGVGVGVGAAEVEEEEEEAQVSADRVHVKREYAHRIRFRRCFRHPRK